MSTTASFDLLGRPKPEVAMPAGRRSFLKSASIAAVATVFPQRRSAAAVAMTFDVTAAPFNADQSGNNDCTAAFQAALNTISSYGRGTLKVPGGNYLLNGPLTCTNAALTVQGDGQASSILVVAHNQTALTVDCNSTGQCVTIKDIGFSPIGADGGIAGTAIAISHPSSASGWPGCALQNIDLGVPLPGYTVFKIGLAFENLWRGHIENVNWHSNLGVVSGTWFATLSGTTIDTNFKSCTIDGVGCGIVLFGYAEGLHLNSCVFIGTHGLYTGVAPYSGDGVSTPFVNLLGLYITECEFNTTNYSLSLYCVTTGWISGSHFSTQTSGVAAVEALGCDLLHIDACSITGAFNPEAPQVFTGISTGAASNGWPTGGMSIADCEFYNLSCGIMYGPGTVNCTATGIRMFSPGNASLVSAPIIIDGASIMPELDSSGNTTNTCQSLGSSVVVNPSATKFSYTRP